MKSKNKIVAKLSLLLVLGVAVSQAHVLGAGGQQRGIGDADVATGGKVVAGVNGPMFIIGGAEGEELLAAPANVAEGRVEVLDRTGIPLKHNNGLGYRGGQVGDPMAVDAVNPDGSTGNNGSRVIGIE